MTRSPSSAALLAPLIAALFSVGCRPLLSPSPWSNQSLGERESPVPAAGASKSPQAKSPPKAREQDHPTLDPLALLSEPIWTLTIVPSGESAPPRHRFRHAGVEELAAHPDGQRLLRQAFESDHPTARVNAAIALARQGDTAGLAVLAQTARTSAAKIPLRRAAIEAIGSLPPHIALPVLEKLADDLGVYAGEQASRYIPEIHAELVTALAKTGLSRRDPRFTAALRSPAADVRLSAVESFVTAEPLPPPSVLLDLSFDNDPRIRQAVLRAAVAQRFERAEEAVVLALNDENLEVRLAAVRLLGKLGGEKNRARLRELKSRPAEAMRAAAVSGLAAIGDWDSINSAIDDKSWRVREAIAVALAHAPPSAARDVLARRLLKDRSLEVQRQLVRSLASWSLADAGPLLLLAIGENGPSLRREASQQLRERWPPAGSFPSHLPADRTTDQLAALREQWSGQFGPSALAETDPVSLPPQTQEPIDPQDLEHLINNLSSGNLLARRRAAADLSRQTRDHMLPAAALESIAQHCTSESDGLVVASVLTALLGDSRPAAHRLALASTSHPQPEARRRACVYFEQHPHPTALPALLACLQDPVESVPLSALRALKTQPSLADPRPIEKLLASRDPELRLQAAECLALHRFEQGLNALLRFASAPEPALRRRAAKSIGVAADSASSSVAPLSRELALAKLVELLDDLPEVRDAALASLPAVAGETPPPTRPASEKASLPAAATTNSSPTEGTRAQEVRLWKTWFNHRAASRGGDPAPRRETGENAAAPPSHAPRHTAPTPRSKAS